MSSNTTPILPSPNVLKHVVDVHNHVQNLPITTESMDALSMTICPMAWQPADQHVVAEIARKWPEKVVPGFGVFPDLLLAWIYC